MIQSVKKEIQKVVIGQGELIDALLIALFSRGHILIEGPPGLAKTTSVKALANVCNLSFKRVQFTPDLLPSDIIGSEIINLKTGEFTIKKGPIFTNLLLADEINRASAKVQSALLEAMAENQVTISNKTFILDNPFMVLATANPIENEGTYELPEASLDRFMLKVKVDFNNLEDEIEIILKAANDSFEMINKVLDIKDIFSLENRIKTIYCDKELVKYIATLIDATREPMKYGLDNLDRLIDFGISPRGGIALYKASKVKAFLENRDFVTPSDIASTIFICLRHRIVVSYEAIAQKKDSDYILEQILQHIDIP
jgi:MoxR-like ATPase